MYNDPTIMKAMFIIIALTLPYMTCILYEQLFPKDEQKNNIMIGLSFIYMFLGYFLFSYHLSLSGIGIGGFLLISFTMMKRYSIKNKDQQMMFLGFVFGLLILYTSLVEMPIDLKRLIAY